MAALITERGADRHAVDAHGRTALHIACARGHTELAGHDVSGAGAEQIELAPWAARCAAAGARLREAISGYTAHRLQLTVRPGNCMCAVCMKTVVEVVFLPCMHASLCRRCFANNAHHGNCMVCAAAVTSVEDVIVT